MHLLQSLQKCLELRDKYMIKSLQRLGDDPRDYDGHFKPLGDDYADVSGVRPDVPTPSSWDDVESQANAFKPWNIYPKPPPPHWHWKDKEVVSQDGTKNDDDDFDFAKCEIPGAHEGWTYSIDMKGVFQVFNDTKGTVKPFLSPLNPSLISSAETNEQEKKERKPAFDIPDIREYFLDLEYVLSIISDGPTKSFAYRRLKYLSGKFTMYTLLNEFEELADMKVSHLASSPVSMF